MALNLTGIHNVAVSTEMLTRVKAALWKKAQYLHGTVVDPIDKRRVWSDAALKLDAQADGDAPQAMKYVASNGTTVAQNGTLSDADVEYMVNVWVDTILLA